MVSKHVLQLIIATLKELRQTQLEAITDLLKYEDNCSKTSFTLKVLVNILADATGEQHLFLLTKSSVKMQLNH